MDHTKPAVHLWHVCIYSCSAGVQCAVKLPADSSVRVYDETRVCESQVLHQQGELFAACSQSLYNIIYNIYYIISYNRRLTNARCPGSSRGIPLAFSDTVRLILLAFVFCFLFLVSCFFFFQTPVSL